MTLQLRPVGVKGQKTEERPEQWLSSVVWTRIDECDAKDRKAKSRKKCTTIPYGRPAFFSRSGRALGTGSCAIDSVDQSQS